MSLMKKKVITIRDKRPQKQVPRILPPMENDRPETPRNDSRSLNSVRSNNLHNLSINRFTDLNEPGVSGFDPIKELFQTAQNTDDLAFAIQSFEAAAKWLEDNKNCAPYDITAYHQLYPLLVPIVDTAPGPVLLMLVNGLNHILSAMKMTESIKPQPPSTPNSRKGTRVKKLEPLPPLDPEPEANKSSESKDLPTEHFHLFMAKILYKMSSDKANDEIFLNPDLISTIISLTSAAHKMDTRAYSLTALKNETQNLPFRQKLAQISNYPDIINIFDCNLKKPKLLQVCAGVCRNMMFEKENIDVLLAHNVHIHLFNSMIRFDDNAELCYTCFRILTKISDRSEIRKSIIAKFSDTAILTLFLTLMMKHPTHHMLLSRLAYVFADFATYESTFIETAGKINDPYSITVVTDKLADPEVLKDQELTGLLLQIVANLSIDPECASTLSLGDSIAKMLVGHTFVKDDKIGFHLLCVASNFTFHDHYWSPHELIEAVPLAIISKHTPSIIETLRTLCNMALAPNTMLIESKIPELLGILIKHVNPDIVLYSLQSLANLINHAGIRRRFRSDGFVESLLELLQGEEEIDEFELEAISALIMNFGAITQEEAQKFLDALELFEIPPNLEIPSAFHAFLKQQLRVDC